MTIPTFVREITSLDERHYRCLLCDRKYVAQYNDPDLAGKKCQQPGCKGLIGVAETEGIRPAPGGEGAEPTDPLPMRDDNIIEALFMAGVNHCMRDDPNGLIIQLPNVAICPRHKRMHFGTTCPNC